MSIDNGVYILKTKEGQYRVIHTQAIDNLFCSYLNPGKYDQLVPTRIIEYFNHCRYTYDRNIARDIAFNKAREIYLEYGIREITVNKTWEQIVKEAKEIAQLEIKEIQKKDNIDHWKWEINKLQEIINM